MLSHDTWRLSALTKILAWVCSIMFWGGCLYSTMVDKLTKIVHKWHLPLVCSRLSSSCILTYKHMTLDISKFNYLPLAYQNAILSSNVSQCATLNFIIKIFFHLEEVTYVNEWIILTITICDTLRPLGISFSPSQVVYLTLSTINGVVSVSLYIALHARKHIRDFISTRNLR